MVLGAFWSPYFIPSIGKETNSGDWERPSSLSKAAELRKGNLSCGRHFFRYFTLFNLKTTIQRRWNRGSCSYLVDKTLKFRKKEFFPKPYSWCCWQGQHSHESYQIPQPVFLNTKLQWGLGLGIIPKYSAVQKRKKFLKWRSGVRYEEMV